MGVWSDVLVVCCTRVSQVQCTNANADCGKWRQLSKETQLTAALASSYRCGMKLNSVKVSSAPLMRSSRSVSRSLTPVCLCSAGGRK